VAEAVVHLLYYVLLFLCVALEISLPYLKGRPCLFLHLFCFYIFTQIYYEWEGLKVTQTFNRIKYDMEFSD